MYMGLLLAELMVCINYYKTILNSLYKLQEAKIVLLNINEFKGKKKIPILASWKSSHIHSQCLLMQCQQGVSMYHSKDQSEDWKLLSRSCFL